jgi:predicted nucleic acid-binding Zn ribbon protein
MPSKEVELQCECPRCGKSAYHTVQWLRDNASVVCERCANPLPSVEVLRENANAVQNAAMAERLRRTST